MSYHPNPKTILLFANRKRCVMCKHKESEGRILPKGKYHPSPKWMFHYEDTHGLPHDVVVEWIWKLVYGIPLTIGGGK